MTDEGENITVNVKGPSEIKLTVQVSLDSTVRGLKEKIAEQRGDVPADSQRLIYTGKVLKDEETLASYKLQNNHTIHMVRSAARSTPVSGNPSSSATTGASSAPSAPTTSAAQGVPSSFGTGQAFGSDPLAALNRADFAGPHMAALNRDLFQGFGMNPNDPNMLMTAMQSEDFRSQMRNMLQRPEVIDQIIASNPQLSQMPGIRDLFRSEQFREFLLDPQSMARAAELSRQMGGMGGMGMNPFGGLGSMGGAAGQGQTGGAQWPPAGAFGTQTQQGGANSTGGAETGAAGSTQQPAGSAVGANPFAALLGQAGQGGGANANPLGMFDPALMQQLLGGTGGVGQNPFGAFGRSQSTDSRPPEERYAEQLAQMQAMGMTDGSRNLRALLMAGGSVEGAMSILFDDPTAGGGGASTG